MAAADRLVVSYAAIDAALTSVQQAVDTLDLDVGACRDVGSTTLYAEKLDAALRDYSTTVQQVGANLIAKANELAAFLRSSEAMYRYVDEHAASRAVPYDPAHPAPTLTCQPFPFLAPPHLDPGPPTSSAPPSTAPTLTGLGAIGPAQPTAPPIPAGTLPMWGEPGPAGGVADPVIRADVRYAPPPGSVFAADPGEAPSTTPGAPIVPRPDFGLPPGEDGGPTQ